MRNAPALIKMLFFPLLAALVVFAVYPRVVKQREETKDLAAVLEQENPVQDTTAPEEKPQFVTTTTLPSKKTLKNDYHVFQTFNNCGPASLSMALSYYGIKVSQKELGAQLRPYQNSQGDNDDKSVTLEEIGNKAEEYGLLYYHRPAGNPNLIKQFIFNDIPVIARTWLKYGEDIAHFRVIKGYDDTAGVFIQDDSYQGKNLEYTYWDFNKLWEAFNYEYIVLVRPEQKDIVEKILGESLDEKTAWEIAKKESEKKLSADPASVYDRFNLSVADYYLEDYEGAVEAYEAISARLPFRMLWYQIEPILAYNKLGEEEKVLEMTAGILNNNNRAFSELYQLRGRIYLKRGDLGAAREEFEKALYYNKNYRLEEDELAVLN